MWQKGAWFRIFEQPITLKTTSADTSLEGTFLVSKGGDESSKDTGCRTKALGLHVTDVPPLTIAVPIPATLGLAEVHLSGGGACQGFV